MVAQWEHTRPHLWGRRFKPWNLCREDSSFLLMVSSLQYKPLANCMYWFPLPIKNSLVYSVERDVTTKTNKVINKIKYSIMLSNEREIKLTV